MKLTDEFVRQILREAAVEIYGDEEVCFEEEVKSFAEWSGENGDLVAETIGYAVKLAAEKLGYPKPVHYYWQILPWHPDAYAPDEDIAFILVDDDGKCLTFRKGEFGEATISKVFPLRNLDDAIKIVKELVKIVLGHNITG
jgi:hypothetical protein